uniref:OSJNBb0034I13.12 protein n=1 Tax=Oryza sativa subsp. japonica TaxID=39947 RepID=Q7XTU8_ORYSJ|nr:OSJNBb0034I13.12 [Oryza sativa Japonica Group]
MVERSAVYFDPKVKTHTSLAHHSTTWVVASVRLGPESMQPASAMQAPPQLLLRYSNRHLRNAVAVPAYERERESHLDAEQVIFPVLNPFNHPGKMSGIPDL